MKKFAAIFSVPAATMQDWMANTDEATRKSQMEEMMTKWNAWKEAHKEALVEGSEIPLGKTKRVTKDGMTDMKNDLTYMMMVQAESHEEAAQLFADSPDLQMIPNSFVDVMDTSGPQG